ncbi:uncharacterized protein LOC121610282 [Chelmon rostratus]|uniref:uncharacterized protein LOC121610282 n=1 Tax=Chelmon rostratus TaxID=109905 RepID=UPI001BE71827|nr:uncharacterized protein LOC121610282 [Chelmon rostratus]
MHGEVHSPQYPQPYPPNLLEQWDLSVPEGYQIRLTFTHLDIEASPGCHYDALTVLYDDKVLGKFCGNENSADGNHPGNHPMLSPGNRLTLIFQTDDNNPERHQNVGFSAQYQATDIDECSAPEEGSGPLCSQICLNTLGSYLCSCHHGYELRSDQRTCLLSCSGGIFDEPEGHLFSPGYPNPPPHAVSCQYIISAGSGFTVSLNFTDNFHIESVDTQQGPSCLHHWLQVTIPGQEPMKLCGGKSPGLMTTNSNTVTLDYHTDDDGLSSGWSLDYSTHRVKCPFPGTIAKGRVTPFLTEYLYRDYIFARCDQGYKLMMDGQEIESFSTMCQSNGQWHLPLPECHICGQPTQHISAYQRIIGGREAPENTIPWQVLLSIDGQRAGGMVIADRWIMTAAHVLKHDGSTAANEAVRIYMGLTDVKTLYNSPVSAASVHIHPEYNNPNLLDFNNDIALIKLQDPITFNSSVMPICLPAEGATYTTGMMGCLCLSASECWQLASTETVMHGKVQSPQYPQPYLPNLQKEWDLCVPEGYQIELSLTHLDIKPSMGCYQDSLTYIISVEPRFAVTLNFTDNFHIESVDTQQGPKCLHHWLQVTIPDREPMKLCGGKSPGLIATNSSTVRLDYHTDDEGLSLGWRLDYSTNVCGQPTKLISTYQRIIGGREAPENTIPWQVLVNIAGIRAGGTVIADRWIMTAAHDLTQNRKLISKERVRVYMGHTDVKTLYNSPVLAASIHIHPEYNNPNGLNFNNDIALIKLQDPITFNSSVMPICLPAEGATYITGIMGLMSGFGIMEIYPPRTATKLKYVHLPVVDQETCQNSVNKLKKTRNNVPSLTNNMFCAGVPEGGKDSCLGDSGSPLALSDDGRFWAAGIVSWGVDCGQQGTYRVYTKVTNYLDWINQTMQENGHLQFLCWSASECWHLPNSQPVIHWEVQSPRYPQPYLPNLLKQWDLWIPEGYQIQLSITHLDIKASLGCYQDSLTVLHDQKVLGKFCGQENSNDHPGKESILSQGNSLTLIFQTSDSIAELQQHIGFAATYKAIDVDECSKQDPGDDSGPLCSQICINTPGSYYCSCHNGYKLHSDQRTCLLSCDACIFDKREGRLSSPGYPDPSPPFLSCKYIISVEPRFTVTLNFTDNFHIESVGTQQGPRCLHHWLQVTIPDREPMKLCGAKSPGLIATNSSTVRLDYHTDNEGLSLGWRLDYSTNEVKCPFPGNVAKGRVTPVLTEYFFRDYIYVSCDQGYRLMMDGQEIQKFSAKCQRDGQWHLPLPECRIMNCGEPQPLLNGGVTFQNEYRSVVQYHCNEPFYSLPGGANVSFSCDADGKWRSKHNNDTPTCIPVCGQPTNLISTYQRIIGGREAPENTIPWQVLLSVDGLRAGGMVIADRWIMAAATDLTREGKPVSPKVLRVYMGHTDVKNLYNSLVLAASIHIHPEYNNPNFLDFNNDIALIKLQDPITFNSSIMPICLPAEGATYITGIMGLVSGFGLTESGKRRLLTNRLRYVELPVVDQETCSSSVDKLKKMRSNFPSLTNNMFCAGVPEGGKDSCQGDSGSPLALRDGGRFWAAGIVSWGADCGEPGTYGVYTKVSNYLDWINKTMKEN